MLVNLIELCAYDRIWLLPFQLRRLSIFSFLIHDQVGANNLGVVSLLDITADCFNELVKAVQVFPPAYLPHVAIQVLEHNYLLLRLLNLIQHDLQVLLKKHVIANRLTEHLTEHLYTDATRRQTINSMQHIQIQARLHGGSSYASLMFLARPCPNASICKVIGSVCKSLS